MGCQWGTPSILKVLCESVERIERSGRLFERVDPRLAVHPERAGLDRSDRCCTPVWPVWPLLGFDSGERSSVLVFLWACTCFKFGVGWGLVLWVLEFGVFQQGPAWPVCYTGVTGVGLVCGKSQVLLGWFGWGFQVTWCVSVECRLIQLLHSGDPAWTGLTGMCDRSNRCSVWLLLECLFRCILE
jgi:hypothetical protein